MFGDNSAEKKVKKARKKASKARPDKHSPEDFIHNLQRAAKDLRWEMQHLRDSKDRKRAARIAHDLEQMADDIQHKASQQLSDVTGAATSNVWSTVLITFFLGVFVGIILKNSKD
jgi:type VI protein secretion system component VasF